MSAINTYFDRLRAILDNALITQKDAMEDAAQAIAKSVKHGRMLYLFGSGHGHLLALEGFYRAGGMACVCPMLDERLMLHESAYQSTQWERKEELVDVLLERYALEAGDVLLVTSNSGRNGVPVMLAVEARKRGVTVIALTSLAHSRASSSRASAGLRLYETADIVLNNGGEPGDACVQAADGMKVGPTSTAVGAAMLQAIFCRVKEISLDEGWEAEFFKSSNIDGGDQYNERLIEKYGEKIPGLA